MVIWWFLKFLVNIRWLFMRYSGMCWKVKLYCLCTSVLMVLFRYGVIVL